MKKEHIIVTQQIAPVTPIAKAVEVEPIALDWISMEYTTCAVNFQYVYTTTKQL